MKVLVGCEFSGVVRDAFIRAGHDAMSCDLLPTEAPGPHYQGDVRDVLDGGFDLAVFHPPCTYLCLSGLHWNNRRPGRRALTAEALDFVRLLLNAPIPRIALENPKGCISTYIRPPDQTIQPYHFGHDASKATCFWLKNLPRLRPTEYVPPQHGFWLIEPGRESPRQMYRWANQSPSGNCRLAPSPMRWMNRSKTFPGVAAAMAAQWGATQMPVVHSLSLFDYAART